MSLSTTADLIAAKEAEITNYTRILAEYAARGGGRWYDQGRRHLESLRSELHVLRSSQPAGAFRSETQDERPMSLSEKTDKAHVGL